eukprot:71032_1
MSPDNSNLDPEEVKVGVDILQNFYNILRSKLSSPEENSNIADAYRGKDAEMYRPEQEILSNINRPGVMWGVGSGIASFVFLRRAPKAIARYMAHRKSGGATTTAGWRMSQQNNPFRN